MRRALLVGAVALALSACGGDDDADVAVVDPVVADDAGDDDGDDGGDGAGELDLGDDDAAGGSDGLSLADSMPACGLLTLDDVTSRGIEAVSGPTQVEGDFGFDQCTFEDDLGVAIMWVSVFPPAGGAGAVSDAEDVPGLGVGAIYSPSGRFINVDLSDGTVVSMSIALAAPPDDPRDVLIELAELAIG